MTGNLDLDSESSLAGALDRNLLRSTEILKKISCFRPQNCHQEIVSVFLFVPISVLMCFEDQAMEVSFRKCSVCYDEIEKLLTQPAD